MSPKRMNRGPEGKVSTRETSNVINKKTWYRYISQAKEWAEENGKDLGIEQVEFQETRGIPRKYYDAGTLLEFWREKGKKNTHANYTKVERKLRSYAKGE